MSSAKFRILCKALIVFSSIFYLQAQAANELILSDSFFPESIVSDNKKNVFVSSIATGEIGKISTKTGLYTTFINPGVNLNSTGLYVDEKRNVLWSCAVDLSLQTPSELRAFSLKSGSLVAYYTLPDGGLCADIDINDDALYITDTLLSRIFKLTTPNKHSAEYGNLTLWSADPILVGDANAFLKINGLVVQKKGSKKFIYTTNYSTGQLFRIPFLKNGNAGPAEEMQTNIPLITPDGLRGLKCDQLVVAMNIGLLAKLKIDGNTATVKIISDTLDQPSSLTQINNNLWVSEGQILRFVGADPTPPNTPFKIKRLSVK